MMKTGNNVSGKFGIEVRDDGLNPLILVSAERVRSWLRQLADEAGYKDRATCAFQLNVEKSFYANNYHQEAPSLLIMVSNVPNSR